MKISFFFFSLFAMTNFEKTINRKLNNALRLLNRYAQSHPATLTLGILVGSLGAGVTALMIFDDSEKYKRNPKEKMSFEEARLIAMLENAKESSWQENLENVADAQERFILPSRQGGDVPDFMKQIDQRSVEILQKQHELIDKRKQRKETTRFWS